MPSVIAAAVVVASAAVQPVLPAAAQAVAPAAPVEHRLSPDEIEAAQADGAARNRAAELLAMANGDPSLALPLDTPKAVHGEVGFGIDSTGGRTVFGAETTTLGDGTTLSLAGEYTQFGRGRLRPR